ncbi:MAG TPA: exodeoxyribonuclease VII large subunit [Verrucomicrobiota bacterium]|jgi:exodeoxyribonuclease VII large subunit|nr:exodeoxyribonuclease VII large subunit [Verrucomicrobiota bacterium]HQL78075.1 exodeoxyribonuclease VII large subunit [Verrucomicrobiota bacterium]
MPKPVKSQWDFGELFPPEQIRKVLSVSELTWQIKRLLEQQVGEVWVTGEVTNLRLQSSGHIYFTLKDAGAQLTCVLFRGETQADRALLQDGRKVNLRGEVTVYEPRGQYQLRVTKVELQGIGALQAAFEKLKQRLKAEGLFAPERKRPLPRYPQRIGLVTSPTGAAIRDVLHVIERRNPALEIVLAPCRVQGEGAAVEIAAAVRLLNEFNAAQLAFGDRGLAIDLILVTRGGGSLEDLWAFNEEVVARAIFESALPVVSAIGHEIDFTISDFVADVRAATPSAAAEIITEGVFASGQFLSEAPGRLRQSALQQMEDKRYVLTEITERLARVHPRRRLNDWGQRLDEAQTSLLRCVRQGARQQRQTWHNLAERLVRVRPAALLKQKREVLQQAEQRLRERARQRLEDRRGQLDTLEVRLRLLGPEQVLARGYSITTDAASGQVLRAAAEVKAGQRLKTRLKTGEVFSKVEK